ncbi:hypothetical protein OPT61_g5253 [Boeremia exigua]|uniref:Uncharacterized protein n=1 Tax=Boeremia exigua TaxID=749465 RepID=A0ACC2IB42_9PLEO|nr:hypothetical protein OPT61_g5253 [Boeremia exigua]
MTATALETTLTATTSSTNDRVPLPLYPGLRQSWSCRTCDLLFDTGGAQRGHMKSSWHVYNLKRRIASLPPISLEIFERQIKTGTKPDGQTHKPIQADKPREQPHSRYQCLFCPLKFENDNEEVKSVIDHMISNHSFFIPDQARLSDSTSFLGYLATQVHVWHECLYCGVTRASTSATQNHMKDSGHCKLNFEKEPELWEFWECREAEQGDLSNAALPFGTKAGCRANSSSGSKVAPKACHRAISETHQLRQTSSALPAIRKLEQIHGSFGYQRCRDLARRDEQGIQNISDQQRHALIVAMKRSQKDSATAMRAKEWVSGRKANDQKHDQAYGALSWAKGGMHNLIPR